VINLLTHATHGQASRALVAAGQRHAQGKSCMLKGKQKRELTIYARE
jgi:hypothetical protein